MSSVQNEFEDIKFLGQEYSRRSADSAIHFSQHKYKCLQLTEKKIGDYILVVNKA